MSINLEEHYSNDEAVFLFIPNPTTLCSATISILATISGLAKVNVLKVVEALLTADEGKAKMADVELSRLWRGWTTEER